MENRVCPVCSNVATFKFDKSGTLYFQCFNCKMIYSNPIDQEGLVGGGAHEERNTQQNPLRIERIKQLSYGSKPEDVNILDAGCGFGWLIKHLKEAGFPNTDGWDAYNPEYSRLPLKDHYHIITCIEMIEHTSSPYAEIDVMYRALKKGGVVYLETGFLNAAWEDGVTDEDNPYINERAGHSTIWTHHAMDVAFLSRGFSVIQKLNRHCHLYIKK